MCSLASDKVLDLSWLRAEVRDCYSVDGAGRPGIDPEVAVRLMLAGFGGQPVNAKRIYRLMKKHGLLLARHTGRRRPREHDGKVVTLRSNVRWCSDTLEFTCWNGELVRVAFALGCHDRDVLGWIATTAGISG